MCFRAGCALNRCWRGPGHRSTACGRIVSVEKLEEEIKVEMIYGSGNCINKGQTCTKVNFVLKDKLVAGLEDCKRDSFILFVWRSMQPVSQPDKKNSLTPRVLSNPQLIRNTDTHIMRTTTQWTSERTAETAQGKNTSWNSPCIVQCKWIRYTDLKKPARFERDLCELCFIYHYTTDIVLPIWQ